MSTAFPYDALALKAEALLAAAGRSMELVPPPPSSDPSAPWEGPGALPAAVSVVAVFVGPDRGPAFPPGSTLAPRAVEGRAGRVLLSGRLVLPEPLGRGWTLRDGSVRYVVDELRPVKPGPVTVLWVAQVRL